VDGKARSRSASAHVLLVHPRSPKTFWSFDGALALAKAHGLPVAVGGTFATSTPGASELVTAD